MLTTQPGAGLTRLVIVTPHRRLDMALPDQLPLANLLPGLLQQAGPELADQGWAHDGWLLRRSDGEPLDPAASLAALRVRDGEVVHLGPRRLDWPEPMYDDIVDAIATAAHRRGRRWTGSATRVAGLAAAAAGFAVGLVRLFQLGPPWTVAGVVALAAAGSLLLAGIVLARALSDAGAGAVLAALAMPFAAAGGVLLLHTGPRLTGLTAADVIAGSALLALTGVAGYLGAADLGRVFVGGVTAGIAGVLAGVAALAGSGAVPAAAVVVGLPLLVSPVLPALAVRIGQIPLPELPRTPEDLVRDGPRPDRREVFAATVRADEALTGMLVGVAAVTIAGVATLVHSGQPMAVALAVVVSLAHLLRARFYVGVRHRLPQLVAGVAGLALFGSSPGAVASAFALPIAIVAGAVSAATGLVYRNRAPSPRLGRLADILDVLLTLAVLPLVAGVLGTFSFMRGLGG
jgi:type VII secretion integral membrane protein EccD